MECVKRILVNIIDMLLILCKFFWGSLNLHIYFFVELTTTEILIHY